jgi:hypothetical protein
MAVYMDNSGDAWTPGADGLYSSPGLFSRTLDDVRSAYGPLSIVDGTEGDRSGPQAAGLTRLEALAKATETVNALSTNVRGYQDGVRLPEKVASVERLARFLVGDADPEEDFPDAGR